MSVPVGTILAYCGDRPPKGWLVADGTDIGAFSDPVYAELQTLLGERFNRSGEKKPICRVPDLAGRTIVGTGLYVEPGNQFDYRVGTTAGRTSVELSMKEVPRHSHRTAGAWHPIGAEIPDAQPIGDVGQANLQSGGQLGSFWEYKGYQTSAEGRSAPFEIRPPLMALLYIIKYANERAVDNAGAGLIPTSRGPISTNLCT